MTVPKSKITKAELQRICTARTELVKIIEQQKRACGSQTLIQTFEDQKDGYNEQIADALTEWLKNNKPRPKAKTKTKDKPEDLSLN